ncbi:MAG: GNAT family N-acetyltransferase [Chloroflexi bacterium]|nr:GNAT family N-acetyltransferase [Chloroflexota bacterium]
MNAAAAIHIQSGLPAQYRQPAAELYFEAFHQKLGPVLKSRGHALSLLEKSFTPELAIVALAADQLAGIAGLQYGGRHFAQLTAALFRAEFGWLDGLWRCGVFAVFNRPQRAGELLMDGLVVHPAQRGRGVGTLLLNAVFDFAGANGFTSVRLDVVDTNPNARRLYERLGFVPTKTQQVPYLKSLAGFSASTTMIKSV